MRTNYAHSRTVIAAAALLWSGCTGARPAAPDPAGAGTAGAPAAAPNSIPYTPADVAFMRGMIVHHEQAVTMASFVPDGTETPGILRLAERIDASQEYEIGLMRRWLTDRGEAPPEPEPAVSRKGRRAYTDAIGRAMAGMASPTDMATLKAAREAEFDRLFLELMIRHHEGALVMLDHLAQREGSGLEPELFVLISHIDADQRAEIARMRRMLNELQ